MHWRVSSSVPWCMKGLLTDTCGTGRRSPHTVHTHRDGQGQTHHSGDSAVPLGWPEGRGRERRQWSLQVLAHPHTHTHTHTPPTPTHLHIGVKLCKFQHNVAGCDGERKVKLDLGLPGGEGCALCLQPNAPFVLQFNCILHRPVAVIQVHHTDLPRGGGVEGGEGRGWYRTSHYYTYHPYSITTLESDIYCRTQHKEYV